MDPTFTQVWWPLHLKSVRGETLSAEEKEIYRRGLEQLDAEESFPGQDESIERTRAEIKRLVAENAALMTRRKQQEEEIAAFEARLAKAKQPA